jgi:hypothetical protein
MHQYRWLRNSITRYTIRKLRQNLRLSNETNTTGKIKTRAQIQQIMTSTKRDTSAS